MTCEEYSRGKGNFRRHNPLPDAAPSRSALIYGANDGLITTFAVVAAASGGALTARTVLIIGLANLFADGLSMGVGNYLSIRSHEGALAAVGRPEEEAFPARHGTATFLAFVLAGVVPLLPYAVGASISALHLGLPDLRDALYGWRVAGAGDHIAVVGFRDRNAGSGHRRGIGRLLQRRRRLVADWRRVARLRAAAAMVRSVPRDVRSVRQSWGLPLQAFENLRRLPGASPPDLEESPVTVHDRRRQRVVDGHAVALRVNREGG